jgi:hypothetical protein
MLTILKYWRAFILLLERSVAETRASADRSQDLIPKVIEYWNESTILSVLFDHGFILIIQLIAK